MEKVITVKEAAKLINVHPHTVRKLIKQGKLEAWPSGGKYFINILSIPAFMRNKK